jgi:hypothetical protein
LVEDVRLLTSKTIYAEIGDAAGYTSLAVTLLTALVLWRR